MKSRSFIALLSVAVVVGAVFFALDRFSKIVSTSRPVSPRAISSAPTRTKFIPRVQTVPQTEIVYVTNEFNWSQVESSDYRQYIANLRAIGCPENTIKDIILTDILKLYAAQRGQFYHNGREFKFWETDEKRKLNAKQLEEREKRLAAIDKEIPSVLRELLGLNYEREINKYFVDTNEDERRLNFLPEEKRARLLALRDEIEGAKERILQAAGEKLSTADQEALQKIEAQRTAALENLLSAPELAEFELRTSATADELRAKLIGFNPTEAEFRQIFEMQKAVGEKFATTDGATETSAREKAAAQKQIDEEIRRQLGEARYADYQRAQNPDFREAYVFTEIYELPSSTAQTLFEIKQIAEGEWKNLSADSAIPETQRLEALHAIQRETEKSLRATLGAKVFASYAQGSGKWIRNLGTN